MNKPAKLLIEKQDRHFWHIVRRETTARGMSDKFKVLEANIPDFVVAKKHIETLHK